jgi:hypothetical protein
MKLLLDENLLKQLKIDFPNHQVLLLLQYNNTAATKHDNLNIYILIRLLIY